ncbi:MAG TPA: PaaI family thioesterase [Casimicrobium huifangae]|jgi:uncharacterized protein (TIGR00369 family)|uniref:PaaI family thioesterase n=1 Tax=Casimicrobium huifangae TaxID=2591109 RepID=UPI0012EBA79B|nr:PaaI family thioesterase [Casimicrobium huifangae]HOB00536.1 PaaI family thioesterase [Casimicrobium huifangae]HQA34038.1 PaaI family thioesterase [Casimicrobium huifangae]HQD65212.1 PaaI family thioesterase [Casimicrobium huifangae]
MLTAQKTTDILNILQAQGAMRLIGARVTEVDEGVVEMEVDFKPELSQQHGYFHAGIIATLVDTAGGCAGATMMPPGSGVLTVEYKLNTMAPGDGEKLRARAEVMKSGRTLTITQGKVWVMKDGKETLCAMMQQTLIALPQK